MADPELSAALLKWVQSFQLSSPVGDWQDLRSGDLLWDILRDIDPEYFTEPLPSSLSSSAKADWIPRWQNLKHINRNVTSYVRDVCGTLEEPSPDMIPDLKAMANTGSARDTVVLLKTILRAAMYSPESNERMRTQIMGLGPEVAMKIAGAMALMEDQDAVTANTVPNAGESGDIDEIEASADDDDRQDSTRGTSVERDAGLEQEEKLIQAHRIIRQMEVSHAKATVEVEDLRREKTSLEQALESFRYEVENQGQSNKDQEHQKLRAQADKDKDYIAELETDLENTRSIAQSQERQLERLKADTDGKQKMKDDLQVLCAERDELLQKSKATENLKKKIQTLQDQEKQNMTLREELKAAQEKLQSLETLKEQCASLQKANTENMTIIANGEQEIFDQKTTRKRLEHEYKVLVQRWEVAKERQGRDHEIITELENRLQAFDSDGITPSIEKSGLDLELDATEAAETAKQGDDMHAVGAPSAEYTIIEEKLRAITARNSKLEQDFLDILQDKLGLETAIEDLRDTSREPEENVPFLEQRKKLIAAEAALSKLKDSCFSITAQLASVKERLLASQERGRPLEGEALNSSAEYQALSRSYAELTNHSEEMETELAEQRSLLRHALLNPFAAGREPEDVRRSNEYLLVQQQLEGVRNAPDDAEILVNTATNLANKIDGLRSVFADAQKRAKDQSATISALKHQIEEKAKAQPVEEKPATSELLKNLERENKLMSTAWYALASRVQSDTVMLGRRKESPKSWLGKQRAIVGGGIGGAGVRGR